MFRYMKGVSMRDRCDLGRSVVVCWEPVLLRVSGNGLVRRLDVRRVGIRPRPAIALARPVKPLIIMLRRVETPMPVTNWSQVAGTIFLGLVGLWLAHNYRRQIRLKLAERQADAYMRLWTLTSAASPGRLTPPDRAERQKLADEINRWYFDEGAGIFVSAPTRDLLIGVLANLVGPIGALRPVALAEELAGLPEPEAERRRGCAIVRQMSLLRTQLKTDLAMHFSFYATATFNRTIGRF